MKFMLLTPGAALAATAALAQPMGVEDLAKVTHVDGQAVSPDGSRIAYVIDAPRNVLAGDEDGAPDSQLYVAWGESSNRAYVTGGEGVSDIAWRPDGGAVSFVSKRGDDEHDAIWSIAVDGGEAQRVFGMDANIEDYVWGPNGDTIYFIAKEAGDKTEEKLKDKGFKAWVYEEDHEFSHLWRVRLNTADTPPQAERIGPEGDLSNLVISDDGQRLAVSVAPTPLIDDYYMKRQVHVLDANGEPVSVIETPGKLGLYKFSPSGEAIAMTAGIDINDPSAGVMMIANAETGAYQPVEPEAEHHVMDVEWLSGGEILAIIHEGVQSRLTVYSSDGEALRNLDQPEELIARDVALGAERNRIGLIADAPDHPKNLYAAAPDGAFALWADHNGWLENRQLADQRVFEYEARDGQMVQGVLVTPNGEAPAGGWPLMMLVHGGPEAHRSNGWHTRYSEPGQVAAGQGYAAFWPNYRGSTGRGVAYAKQHQNDYAGKEFNDLVDAIGALAEAGIVDPDRAGITGGSYGGYASAWGATALSEHFAASVMFVGISDQISKFGTTDIPDEMYNVHARKWPWEDWQNMLEVSPIYYAGESRTPTLILHGEDDTRVHPSQSMELYRHLKLRSEAPVRLVFYPGEGHGNRKAAAQYDYTLRLMRWMDHYLQGDGGEPPAFDLDLAGQLGIEAAD